MPRRSAEEQAAYLREWRAKRKALILEPEMIDKSVFAGKPAPITVTDLGETPKVKPETMEKPVKTGRSGRKPAETAEIPKNDLETRLHRQRADNGRNWQNPYRDGLPDWPDLIQSVSQHWRDGILDRLVTKQR